MRKILAACVGLLTIAVQIATADEWPQFRNATGDGVSTEKNLPVKWSTESGIQWQVDLAGRANSSPAVTAKRVDLTTADADHGLWVLCFDRATGEPLQKVQVGSGVMATTGEAHLWTHRHNAATPTPAADDQHVYAFFGTGLVVCVEAASGTVVWSRDLVKDYGQYTISFGMSSSPRLWGDLVILACLTKDPAYVVALDKKTGKDVWKRDRKFAAHRDAPDTYATPMIFQNGGRTELLVSGSDHITAYDPLSGKPLWQRSGLKINSTLGRIIASPTAAAGVVVATTANPGGGQGHILGIKAGGKGDVSKSAPLWNSSKSTPDSSTPVCYEGRVYHCSDDGIATCLNLKTGKLFWQHRLSEGPYHAALVAGDDKVYFLSIDGACSVLKAGTPKPQVLGENKLPGTFYATPAISDGVIYLRAYEKLYAITGDSASSE